MLCCYYNSTELDAMQEIFRLKKILGFVVAVSVFSTLSDSVEATVFESLFGRKGLPVYHMPRGNPKPWVHRNSVHFLTRAMDYSQIQRRINRDLSTACALGRFNQRRDKEFFVVVRHLRKNVVILGYAHGRGVNLHDPFGMADKTSGYLFRYDKSGKCQVFADQ